jgi:putative endonuclease
LRTRWRAPRQLNVQQRDKRTQIARDAGRRADEHNGVAGKGARYTASRRPVRIVYQAVFASRSEALREEIRIKRLSRALKDELIAAAADDGIFMSRS